MTPDPLRARRGVYGISVAAELSGLDPQTLRLYERRGLLNPARTAGGTRRYSDNDLEIVQRIVELVGSGINIAGIARILELEANNAALKEDNDRLRSTLDSRPPPRRILPRPPLPVQTAERPGRFSRTGLRFKNASEVRRSASANDAPIAIRGDLSAQRTARFTEYRTGTAGHGIPAQSHRRRHDPLARSEPAGRMVGPRHG